MTNLVFSQTNVQTSVLANVIVFDNVFSFKSSNVAITIFDSIVVILNSGI